MTRYFQIFTIAISFVAFSSCQSDDAENQSGVKEPQENYSMQDEVELYITEIENQELSTGNSLYYSKEDGSNIEVDIFLNDSNKVVKTLEKYSKPGKGSIYSNVFYYKSDKKYVTKEFFEEGEGEAALFVERVTYYDKKGKAVLSKLRKAVFEDQLDAESFTTVTTHDCSDANAVKVLNQLGEYETTFRFFVNEGGMLYLVVGEDKEDGYRSSLLVQNKNQVIQQLLSNEKAMVGKPLVVDFETISGAMGFEFQSLLNVSFKE